MKCTLKYSFCYTVIMVFSLDIYLGSLFSVLVVKVLMQPSFSVDLALLIKIVSSNSRSIFSHVFL